MKILHLLSIFINLAMFGKQKRRFNCLGAAADTLTYFNKYTCTTASSNTIVGVNDATYTANNLDTALYLGDFSS